jgi:hypothetical protein
MTRGGVQILSKSCQNLPAGIEICLLKICLSHDQNPGLSQASTRGPSRRARSRGAARPPRARCGAKGRAGAARGWTRRGTWAPRSKSRRDARAGSPWRLRRARSCRAAPVPQVIVRAHLSARDCRRPARVALTRAGPGRAPGCSSARSSCGCANSSYPRESDVALNEKRIWRGVDGRAPPRRHDVLWFLEQLPHQNPSVAWWAWTRGVNHPTGACTLMPAAAAAQPCVLPPVHHAVHERSSPPHARRTSTSSSRGEE